MGKMQWQVRLGMLSERTVATNAPANGGAAAECKVFCSLATSSAKLPISNAVPLEPAGVALAECLALAISLVELPINKIAQWDRQKYAGQEKFSKWD